MLRARMTLGPTLLALLAGAVSGCTDDAGDSGDEQAATETGDGDGDGDGDGAPGDGDGSPGDGDGSPGDGDGSPGDGDGAPGDGDGSPGDGDGSPGDGDGDPPACSSYESDEEEFAPIQIVQNGLPPGADALTWIVPTSYEYIAPFAGNPNQPASHEGTDYVHPNQNVPEVTVLAAADGVVAYVRLGCPQSSLFGFNNSLRECGSGWGNHVVIDHGNDIYTRYGHMHPVGTAVLVGDVVQKGDLLGVMGNSGRSDERHLHFELGTFAAGFDPCAPSQSMDGVYDPENLPFE